MSPSKARANEVVGMPTTNDFVLFRSPATWPEARHETKIYEQWQVPKKKAWVNNLAKWNRGWWNKHTKKASLGSPI